MQLDIFAHSRDVMLRNDVADALQRRDAVAARGALQLLLSECPSDDLLPALSTLTRALEDQRPARFSDHDALRRAHGEITREVVPAAARVFGDTAGSAWLVPLWRALAHAAEHLPLCRNEHDAHAAPLWIKVGDWVGAQEAVARIASWRRIPTTLCWMAEAQYHQHGLEAIWPLLAELAWLSASRLDELMHRLKDSCLTMLRKTFDSRFEGDGAVEDLVWFPAWALIEKPGLANLLRQTQQSTQSSPERAMRLLLELLNLERHGRHHELVERRKELRGLQPALFAAYMSTR
ncbi:hypothetical protein [Cupriavidus sp. 8B]